MSSMWAAAQTKEAVKAEAMHNCVSDSFCASALAKRKARLWSTPARHLLRLRNFSCRRQLDRFESRTGAEQTDLVTLETMNVVGRYMQLAAAAFAGCFASSRLQIDDLMIIGPFWLNIRYFTTCNEQKSTAAFLTNIKEPHSLEWR